MNEPRKLYTIVFPSYLELAEFKITTNTSWDAIDVEHCSVTARISEKEMCLVKAYGGKIYFNNLDNQAGQSS
jgi:hypothetical protein